MLEIFKAAILTVLIETPLCLLLFKKKGYIRYILFVAILINLITNLLLNGVVLRIFDILLEKEFLSIYKNFGMLLLFEIPFVFVPECVVFSQSFKWLEKRYVAFSTILVNIVSFFVGIYLYF